MLGIFLSRWLLKKIITNAEKTLDFQLKMLTILKGLVDSDKWISFLKFI